MNFKSACAVAFAIVFLSVLLVGRFQEDRDSVRSIGEDESKADESTATIRQREFADERPHGVSANELPREDQGAATPADANPRANSQPALANSGVEPSAVPLDSSGNVQVELERLFNAEDRDNDWSAGMESRILSEISLISGLAANLVEVDCRANLCRIRLTLPTEPPPAQPNLAEISVDGGLVFIAAARLEMETVAVLALGGQFETPTFVAYVRRDAGSRTQSVLEEVAS